ncbi:MAG: hypothetical protein LBE83_10665 [Propionibacteriaceae bacterium]|jgi:hypothetical protein|nr:hypothetical protein [Propionibacteriaceae bacterium]
MTDKDETTPEITLTAPWLDRWLRGLSTPEIRLSDDPVVVAALERALVAAEALEDCGGDEARVFWAELPRGSYDQFRALRDEEEPEDWVRADWEDEYPTETGWFKIALTRYRTMIGLSINTHGVTATTDGSDYHKVDHWPDPRLQLIVAWAEKATKAVVGQVQAGMYNEHVAANLPYRKRIGKIRRADWWTIAPEPRDWHLGDFSADEADRLYNTVEQAREKCHRERVAEMTLDDFLRACQIGYQAVKADGATNLSPRELYLRHADGRHDGLLDLDPTSADAFAEWVKSGSKGGHPWEILRGGNSTHVSLYASYDDQGWWFTVAGRSAGRSVETARIYLALVAAGLPAELRDATNLATMLIGADDIGIVPEDVVPRYCHSYFPGEEVISFMNLEPELADPVIDRAYWYPIPLVRLNPHIVRSADPRPQEHHQVDQHKESSKCQN